MSDKITFVGMDEIEEEKALKVFLLDIDCLNKIDPWISKFNLFDLLRNKVKVWKIKTLLSFM